MDVSKQISSTASQLGMGVAELSDLLGRAISGEEVELRDEERADLFFGLLDVVHGAAENVSVSREAMSVLLVLDDEPGTPVQVRRRLWEDGMDGRTLEAALRELFNKQLVTSNYLGPAYSLTPLGQRVMPSLYAQLGITKLT